MSVQELINAAFNKKGNKFEEAFDAIMRKKVAEALDAKLTAMGEEASCDDEEENMEDDSEGEE